MFLCGFSDIKWSSKILFVLPQYHKLHILLSSSQTDLRNLHTVQHLLCRHQWTKVILFSHKGLQKQWLYPKRWAWCWSGRGLSAKRWICQVCGSNHEQVQHVSIFFLEITFQTVSHTAETMDSNSTTWSQPVTALTFLLQLQVSQTHLCVSDGSVVNTLYCKQRKRKGEKERRERQRKRQI